MEHSKALSASGSNKCRSWLGTTEGADGDATGPKNTTKETTQLTNQSSFHQVNIKRERERDWLEHERQQYRKSSPRGSSLAMT